MSATKKLTFENCAHLLKKQGLISAEQCTEIAARGKAQETRLYALHQSGGSRRVQSGTADIIFPAEVIAAFNFELPGTSGKILTEDMVTEAVSSAVGLPYLKIDPLKLDLDVVTS